MRAYFMRRFVMTVDAANTAHRHRLTSMCCPSTWTVDALSVTSYADVSSNPSLRDYPALRAYLPGGLGLCGGGYASAGKGGVGSVLVNRLPPIKFVGLIYNLKWLQREAGVKGSSCEPATPCYFLSQPRFFPLGGNFFRANADHQEYINQ